MRNALVLSLVAVAALSQAADRLTIAGLSANAGTLALGGTVNGTYSAGPFGVSLNGGKTMQVYCADLLHSAAFGVPLDATLVDTATKAPGYAHAAQILNKYFAVSTTELQHAALQGAIWKAIYGASLTIANGTPDATALATTYLDEDLSAYSTHATFYDLGDHQSMMGVQAVPEPASCAALAVGALGLLRRRKRA